MCGIFGTISKTDVVHTLMDGLSKLEYRGYDSAGVATIHDGVMHCLRASGKLEQLKIALDNSSIPGKIGISHTRWATHGVASERNAHPHSDGSIAIVHNGIIENFSVLKQDLEEKGYVFSSDTDTEVIVHFLQESLKLYPRFIEALSYTLKQLKGAFALAILYRDLPQQIFFARCGSPLVIGHADGMGFLASDALAFSSWTNQVTYLEEGDYGVLTWDETQTPMLTLFDAADHKVERTRSKTYFTAESASKADFNHFMLKEIYEQPTVLSDTLQSFLDVTTEHLHFQLSDIPWESYQRLSIIACGTSYFAGCVAKYWIEAIAGISVDVEIASEYRYRSAVLTPNTLFVVISQSGETIDTLGAIKPLKASGVDVLAIVNVPQSSIAREATWVIHTLAGPEIGVASTKAFTAQLMILAGLAIHFAQHHKESMTNASVLPMIPGYINHILQDVDSIKEVALTLTEARHALYLGRGSLYPIAHEGALKLKEISYIHAEGYAAGELKHGPIALIDSHMPVIMLMPHNEWFEKTLSNMQEVLARGARVICLTDAAGKSAILQQIKEKTRLSVITLPAVSSFAEPFIYAVGVQLLAYYVAFYKGTDIDQPRNLAKSVTVE